MPDDVANRDQFGISQKSALGKAVIQQVNAINKPGLKKMVRLLILKNYSDSTRKTYLTEFPYHPSLQNYKLPSSNLKFPSRVPA